MVLVPGLGHHKGDRPATTPPGRRQARHALPTAVLAIRCRRCGAANPDLARFCVGCGRALAEPPEASRRLVTTLHCDIVNSTGLAECLDVEALHVALDAFFTTVTAAVHAQRGRIEKYAGDAVLAIWGLPHAAEDDAIRAVMAAVEMHRSLRDISGDLVARLGIGLDARIGVATGEAAVLGAMAGESLSVVGDAVNVAARLQGAAGPGEVLVTETTRQLVRASVVTEPIGELALKGKARGVAAHRVLRPSRPDDLDRGDPGCELVGRARELSAVEAAITAAQNERSGRLVVVRGEAGIGKSALIDQVAQRQAAHCAVQRASCRPKAGAGPLSEVTRAVRQLIAATTTARPILIIAEDLHLADAAVTADLEELLVASVGLPVCLLTSSRHDLDRMLPGHANRITMIELGALGPTESTELLHRALPGESATNLDIAELARRSCGNPMFLLELAHESVDLGRIPERAPAAIRSLVAARLDRLPRADRQTLGAAAVVGQHFTPRELAEALGVTVAPDLTRLANLDLIIAEGSAWRFAHVLVRDEVYDQMPRLARAEIHERLARHSAHLGDAEVARRHFDAARSSRLIVGGFEPFAAEPTRDPAEDLTRTGLDAPATAAAIAPCRRTAATRSARWAQVIRTADTAAGRATGVNGVSAAAGSASRRLLLAGG
jgi:class 3 adenylate cyclase